MLIFETLSGISDAIYYQNGTYNNENFYVYVAGEYGIWYSLAPSGGGKWVHGKLSDFRLGNDDIGWEFSQLTNQCPEMVDTWEGPPGMSGTVYRETDIFL